MFDMVKQEVGTLAQRLMALAPAEVPPAYGTVLDLIEALETLKSMLRERLVNAVQNGGKKTSENGSMAMQLGNSLVEIRPQKTGLDSRKVEMMLRARGFDPLEWMDAKVMFSANAEKLDSLVAGRVAETPGTAPVTKEDVALCKYDKAWALQRPKKMEESNVDH